MLPCARRVAGSLKERYALVEKERAEAERGGVGGGADVMDVN
jgi:hypothetical protein